MSGTQNQDWLFTVATPLGFSVRVSRAEWATILAKHPDLTERVEDIKAALTAPDEVRQSRRDAGVLLFYRQEVALARWVVAVTRPHEEAGTDHGLPNGRRQGGQADMACVRVFFEQDKELLTVFWQEPRADQICMELDDGVILIKDGRSGEPIGIELFAYRPGDDRFDSVHVDVGGLKRDVQPSARA